MRRVRGSSSHRTSFRNSFRKLVGFGCGFWGWFGGFCKITLELMLWLHVFRSSSQTEELQQLKTQSKFWRLQNIRLCPGWSPLGIPFRWAETSSCSSQCRVTLCSQASANSGKFASYHGPRLPEVRRFSFHHLDGHNAQGPDVHLGAIRRTGHNFWGHPVSSAHHGAPPVLLRAELSAEAKIS